MVTEDVASRMAEQLNVVVEKAREVFVDRLEERVSAREISVGSLSETDKRAIEQLFSEVAYGHVVAEAAAILSFLIHAELQDDAILDRIVPALMDRCEGRAGQALESVAKKTSGLVDLGRDVINTAAANRDVVTSLLKDVAGMTEARPMRVTFDAVTLSLLGE